MIRVQVRPNEALESALRRFKRQCNYAGIFRLAKKYSHHEKRSDKRRREERERIRNIQRAMRKAERTRVKQPRKSKVKKRSDEEDVPESISVADAPTVTPAKPAAAEPAQTPVTASETAGES